MNEQHGQVVLQSGVQKGGNPLSEQDVRRAAEQNGWRVEVRPGGVVVAVEPCKCSCKEG